MDQIKIYSNYLDNINRFAYHDVSMLSNVTLSKNPYTGSNFLQNIIKGNKIDIPKYIFIKSSALFYIKNIYYLLLWVFYYVYTKLFLNNKIYKYSKYQILIDTYFGYSQINNNYTLKDNYFKELYDLLDSQQIQYIIIPKIFGVKKNPIKMIKLLKYLSKLDNSITEYNMLSLLDIYYIFEFILNYPIKIKKLIASIKCEKNIDKLFVHDILHTLGSTVFLSYVRYLFGKKLKKKLTNKNIKLISWCEYQTIDKNFYKGIKNNNIHIYGCQFLIKYPTLCSCYILLFNLVPLY